VIRGLLGKKVGMTHLFAEEGRVVPVTVLEVGPCVVTQLRTQTTDNYEAVQLGYGEVKQGRMNKPAQGHLKGAGAQLRHLQEFLATDLAEHQVGETLNVRQFFQGEKVHVTAKSKGRGFQGVVKRHGFAGGPKSHGQVDRLRAPGSIGGTTYPGRVFKGKKMPGHMGNERVTVRNLEVAMVDPDRNLLLVRGAVPGSRNSLLSVSHADVEAAIKAYEAAIVAEPLIEETPEVVAEEPVAEGAAIAEPPVEETPEVASEGPVAEAAVGEPTVTATPADDLGGPETAGDDQQEKQ
jgi:large subunit ribosomal protein L3